MLQNEQIRETRIQTKIKKVKNRFQIEIIIDKKVSNEWRRMEKTRKQH